MKLEEKKEILEIFNIDINLLNEINWREKTILISQPLSEDGIVSEEEKINIYKDLIKDIPEENLVIKPHSREKTDYSIIFPKVIILEQYFPLEIVVLLNLKVKEVRTLFSTAAYNFRGKTKVKFMGTEKYPILMKKFGKIEYEE